MAYPGYYPGYQQAYGYMPPMPDQLTQLRQNQFQQPQMAQPSQPPQPLSNPIIWVQGEEGAKGYLVSAGNSVMLMDSENSTFYLKSTDTSGMPLPLRIFDYTERTAAPKAAPAPPSNPDMDYVTRQEFDALTARIEAMTAVPVPEKKASKKKEDDE